LPLTRKQAAFVREYLVDHNATQAAIRAGYRPKHADVDGPRLLGNAGVAEAIDAGEAHLAEKAELRAEDALRVIVDGLDFDPARCFGPRGELLSISEMPLAVRRNLTGFKAKTLVGGDGDDVAIVTEVKWTPVVEHERDARKNLGLDATEDLAKEVAALKKELAAHGIVVDAPTAPATTTAAPTGREEPSVQ
jgi:phage terminase small subunit